MEISTKNYCLTPYVLFLVMAAIFFEESKIPAPILRRISQRTFILSLVPIGQEVSEKKSFERVNDDNGQMS